MKKWVWGGFAVPISRLLGFASGGELMKRILPTVLLAVSLVLVLGLFAFVPLSAASDFFLHSSTNYFLDNSSPTASAAKFKDSPAVNRTT